MWNSEYSVSSVSKNMCVCVCVCLIVDRMSQEDSSEKLLTRGGLHERNWVIGDC